MEEHGNELALEEIEVTKLPSEAEPGEPEVQTQAHRKKRERKKRKFFRLGCLGQILMVVIALVIGFGAGRYVFLFRDGAVSLGTITQKLSLLNAYVDAYYLHDYDEEKVADSVYSGFMEGLEDKYSCYYTEEEYKELTEQDSGEYRGIGVTVYKDTTTNYVTIESVVKGSPADEAGLEAGDAIVEVDGTDVTTMTLNETVSMIKSDESDTTVLNIYRSSDASLKDYTVKKTTIELESVTYEMKSGKIGYISVTQFLENTDEKFIAAVDDLQEQGMKSLIIDLRDNGGGLLDTCVNMLSRIVPKDKLLVYTQDKQGNKNEINSDSDETLDIPIVILVNGNSASASEIFTGCMKDYGLATVIGTQTYGKGVVQSIIPLGDGTALKMTVSEYFTPEGYEVNGNGITPDEVIEMSDDEIKAAAKDASKDKQLNRALELCK